MRLNKYLIAYFVCLFVPFIGIKAQRNSSFVNTFIGTDGTGHTFPGPSMPFGMVQPGPDNRDYGWNHTSGYQYRDTLIMGFSQTRFSGTGINEMGDVLLLPINPKKANAKNSYEKASESAKVGYYSVMKNDGVKVELTCTQRVALHRYTYPEKEAQVLLDLQHGLCFVFDENSEKGLVVESSVKIENAHTISGYCSTDNWVKRKYFFTLTFDQPFIHSTELAKKANEKAPKFLLDFLLDESKLLKVKIALSSVDIDGAKRNMEAELNQWDFQRVCTQNQTEWDTYLNRVSIKAPAKQKELFYTSLYHLLLQPSNIADVDGRFRSANDSIQVAQDKAFYSTLSIWDIYRGAFPLLQIIAPEKIDGIVQSMLQHHQAKGFLPIWTAWGQDNFCMIGNHSIPMILSAYQNGFTGFDAKIALNAMWETSTKSHINSNWELYNQFGYYPFDQLDNESVSRTLESGYDDWCVAEMARKLGRTDIVADFQKRALFYRNLYDPESMFLRGKNSSGTWRTPFDPLMATSPLNNPGDYTEANAWQYFWTPAQYDVPGMMQLLGGEENFTKKLNAFFTTESLNPNKFLGQEAMIGQYAHGNEPSHHILYLYAFTKEPKSGQTYIRQVMQEFHNNTPDGMIGNDDCGQMSAWYVLSTLGFYPVNPADGTFVFGSPQVKKASILLPNQAKFVMKAQHFSNRKFLQENPSLNQQKLDRNFIRYREIMQGGRLTFHMSNK
jgi:predicted alpha-1,2-mannosidase